jgi:hypothetical protein
MPNPGSAFARSSPPKSITSCRFGLAPLVLSGHGGPNAWRDALALLSGAVRLMCSGVWLVMVTIVGLELIRRDWSTAALQNRAVVSQLRDLVPRHRSRRDRGFVRTRFGARRACALLAVGRSRYVLHRMNASVR